jgi:hypothetical protein
MKKWILFIGLCWVLNLSAQTGIGTTSPNASARLDVSATNKGFLPPRVSLSDIYDQSTIPSPATGLLVYCKGDAGLAAGYYYWNGNAWATIATAGGSGSFASSFMRGSRTGTQTIAVGGVVAFSSIDNSVGNDISLNTSNGKITLAAGNTYRIRGAVPNFSGGQRPAFIWYNETTSSNMGSATFAYNPGDAASLGAFGSTAELLITPNVSTVISFRLLSSLSSGSVTVGGNGDFSTTGSYPWFDIQVISGNAPITGQSVDYIQASLSVNQTLSSAGNINFNVSNGTGITLTNGGFNLIANKTYKLEAALGGTSGAYAYYTWVDNNNTMLPGGSIGSIMKAGSAFSDAPQDKAIVYYTPTVDTRVFLRVYSVSSGVTAYAPSTASNYSSTWANITQIGSSAIVNPWVLSGNDVYNTSGEVGIGTSSPSASALLDVTSTNKGILIPRMTSSQKNAISSPTTGLLIFQTDAPAGFYYYNGSSWISISNPGTTTRFLPHSSNFTHLNSGQSITSLGTGTYVAIGSSDLVIDVPSGYSSNKVLIKWDTWGDVSASSAAHGSFRYQIKQTGTSTATYWSAAMNGWAITGSNAATTRFATPVTYILTDLAPGTYTFKLEISREAEVGTITNMNNYHVSGSVQVFVK